MPFFILFKKSSLKICIYENIVLYLYHVKQLNTPTMKTVIYTKGIVNGKELFQLLAEAGTEIMLFLLPSAPEVNNANVDPNGTIFNFAVSDAEFQRHMELNPQIEWVAL